MMASQVAKRARDLKPQIIQMRELDGRCRGGVHEHTFSQVVSNRVRHDQTAADETEDSSAQRGLRRHQRDCRGVQIQICSVADDCKQFAYLLNPNGSQKV